MRKLYLLLLTLCSMNLASSGQTTVWIYATGAAGTFKTGNSTNTTRTDNNIVTTAATQRGYAVFDLSTIPAGATISSCIVGFNVSAFGGGGAPSGWNTYGWPGDLSTVTVP